MKKMMKKIRIFELKIKATENYISLITSLAKRIEIRYSFEKYPFLIPPPGNGNIGDQAMCDAFCEYYKGICVLVVENKNTFILPKAYKDKIKVIEIPNLIDAGFIRNLIAIFKLVRYSNQMSALSVIGADIIDGSYYLKESVNRLFILRLLANLNVKTRILGFSWSEKPEEISTHMLKGVSRETKLLVRDPISLARLLDAGVEPLTLCSDLVFSDLTTEEHGTIQAWIDKSKKPFVVVNISGLSKNSSGDSTVEKYEYSQIISYLHDLSYRIMIMPHVFREKNGDTRIAKELFDLSCNPDDLHIEDRFTPANERLIMKSAEFLVTGRMHPAVIALSVGTPVIALETRGKVLGLMSQFNLENLCVRRNLSFSKVVCEKIKYVKKNQIQISQQINSILPKIQELSKKNYTD